MAGLFRGEYPAAARSYVPIPLQDTAPGTASETLATACRVGYPGRVGCGVDRTVARPRSLEERG